MSARRLLLMASVPVAIGAGVASASVLVPAAPPPPSADGPAAFQPGPAPPTIAAATPDPAGGAPWALRIYRSQTGQTCPTPGRTSLGRFGRFDAAGTFQELPLAAAGSCADLSDSGVALAVERFPAQGPRPARTVIFGTTSAPTDQIVLHDGTLTRAVATDRGAFLIVRADGDLSGVSLDVTSAGARTQTVALAGSTAPPD